MRTAALLVVLLAAVGPATAPVADAAPAGTPEASVEARIAGTSIDGDRVVVTDDPTLTVNGSAPERVETVIVRIDGATRRVFSPNTTEFSRRIPLSLDDGDHRVAVVARTADGRAEAVGTIAKDTTGPRVAYTAPTTTSAVDGPPDTVPVRTPSVELAGQLSDISGVKRVVVTHTYVYTFGGERHRHRQRHVIDNPGAEFSQRLFLGIGANRVRVQLTDGMGHVRSHEFRIKLRDGDAPTVRFTKITRIDGGERVRVTGVVSDDVKVRTVAVTGGHGNSKRVLVEATGAEPNPDRRSVQFETTVPAGPQTGRIRIVASDFQGAQVSRSLPNEYRRPVAPDVQLNDRTRIRDGKVLVRGTVLRGEIKRVTVETTTADGDRIAFATVHRGAITRRVEVAQRLDAATSGRTIVRLRAIDAAGEKHTTSMIIGNTAKATTTRTPAPTATATQTPENQGPLDGANPNITPVTIGAAGVTASTLAAALILAFR